MRECFIERRFSTDSAALIEQANQIIAEYTAQEFVLTLRQLYYQMVARDILANKVQSYKRLGVEAHDIVDSFLIEKRLTTSWTPS